MNERDMRSTAEGTARRVADSAQDAASRAGTYVQSQAGRASERAQEFADRASERAQDLAENARGQVVRLTGKPIESWTADLRRFVSDHPLQAFAITVGVGYLLGKLMQRD
ncbi:MAG: DUF883 family protein [Candidatus Rokuibacteriota bacterium]